MPSIKLNKGIPNERGNKKRSLSKRILKRCELCSINIPKNTIYSLFRKYSSNHKTKAKNIIDAQIKKSSILLPLQIMIKFYDTNNSIYLIKRTANDVIQQTGRGILTGQMDAIMKKAHYRKNLIFCYQYAKNMGISIPSLEVSSFLQCGFTKKPSIATFNKFLKF